ncbi:MAG TPA: hypothetical protein VLL52_02000 [Anaerolineae bacterium]|nr:hypothetical protein [Anaerolineae bacterium]
MAYFPQITYISKLATIRRERILPRKGEITVRMGQSVSIVQILARSMQETGFQMFRASEWLGIPPQDVAQYVLLSEGEMVRRGMPLITKPTLIGRDRTYVSPIDGTLHQIRHGSLILQESPKVFELRSMIPGYITKIIPQRSVVVETKGSIIQAILGSSAEGYGKIKMGVTAPDEALKPDVVEQSAIGNIIVGGYAADITPFELAEEKGARGLILGAISAELLDQLHKFTYPIIITDGIGNWPMSKPAFELLQESEGQEASLFGQTPWSGNYRPEIIIPQTAAAQKQSKETMVDPLSGEGAALTVGEHVRIIRGEHLGAMGEVVNLYTQPRTIGIGLRLPGADIKLENGDLVFVPYTNLDLIM